MYILYYKNHLEFDVVNIILCCVSPHKGCTCVGDFRHVEMVSKKKLCSQYSHNQ